MVQRAGHVFFNRTKMCILDLKPLCDRTCSFISSPCYYGKHNEAFNGKKKIHFHKPHINCVTCTQHMCDVISFFLCSLQILMNARRGGTPVPTTRCASTWREAMTAGAPTGTTAPVTVSMTTRSSTVGRSGCWTLIGARCAPVR